jgi:hypothetical protein
MVENAGPIHSRLFFRNVVAMTQYTFKFDFEIGHLIKSPCKECAEREKSFPRCAEFCALLDKLQRALAGARSISRN